MEFLKVKDSDYVYIVTDHTSEFSMLDPAGGIKATIQIYRVSAGLNQETKFIPVKFTPEGKWSVTCSVVPQSREEIEGLLEKHFSPSYCVNSSVFEK